MHFHIHRDSIQLTRTTVTIATTLDAGRSAAEKRNEMKDSRKTEVRRELACQEVKADTEVEADRIYRHQDLSMKCEVITLKTKAMIMKQMEKHTPSHLPKSRCQQRMCERKHTRTLRLYVLT